MKFFLLQVVLAFLAATVLAAPTTKEQRTLSKHEVISERALRRSSDYRSPFVVKEPAEVASIKRIVISAEVQAPTSAVSAWLSRLIFNKDQKLSDMACFCAGGSLCCHGPRGRLDCNVGNCGI